MAARRISLLLSRSLSLRPGSASVFLSPGRNSSLGRITQRFSSCRINRGTNHPTCSNQSHPASNQWPICGFSIWKNISNLGPSNRRSDCSCC
ncbi:hypothetical protein F0562_024801 [Nyssa sinensis]|uniref:Uncharacterized protein n=1 Tax=Nyssa sinensis TaxID=561372 RepID=A0A5J5BE33_9ASTE|nr:hypothetical protein F0562_024801 [Nyssa sinensis]